MIKKIFFSAVAFVAVFIFLGAGCNDPTHGEGGPGPEPGKETATKSKSLSAMEDVCNYFPKEIVEEAIGKPIVHADNETLLSSNLCHYYTEYSEDYNKSPYGKTSPGGPHILVSLVEENHATEEIAKYEPKGYQFVKDDSFSWEHYLVKSKGSKTAYRVDLLIDENHFFMIKSNHFGATDEEIVKIGKRLSERMKNGK